MYDITVSNACHSKVGIPHIENLSDDRLHIIRFVLFVSTTVVEVQLEVTYYYVSVLPAL